MKSLKNIIAVLIFTRLLYWKWRRKWSKRSEQQESMIYKRMEVESFTKLHDYVYEFIHKVGDLIFNYENNEKVYGMGSKKKLHYFHVFSVRPNRFTKNFLLTTKCCLTSIQCRKRAYNFFQTSYCSGLF